MRHLFKKIAVGSFFLLLMTQPVLAYVPNDPLLPEQSYLQRLDAFTGWDYVMKHPLDQPMVIAVLDTGVDLRHPDLVDSIWINQKEIPGNGLDDDHNSYIDDLHGWNFIDGNNDPEPAISPAFNGDALSHGTIVSGIIAAGFDNGLGIAGLAPGAKIMPIKALDNNGSGNTIVLAQAIDYAVDNGADVINLSLVGKVYDPKLNEAINRAYISGVAVVAAAGNEDPAGVDMDASPRYPVCDPTGVNQVLGVAALTSDNVLSRFSNYGAKCIDVSAPGTGIYSTTPIINGNPLFSQYYSGGWAGTSVAAPLVSATIANLKRVAPKLTLDTLYNIITANATNIQAVNPANPLAVGTGLINMGTSLKVADQLQKQQQILLVIAPLVGRPEVSLINRQGNIQSKFLAYAAGFNGGVNLAVSDINNDGSAEIITAPHSGGGPQIRIFSSSGQVKGQFMAYDKTYRTGYSIAAGDVDADGQAEIVVAPNGGASSLIRIFDQQGNLKSEWLAYDKRFRGGVSLAAYDIDHDGQAEIISLPRKQGGPHLRIFDNNGNVKTQFMAGNTRSSGPYALAVGDIDHDLAAEIMVADLSAKKTDLRIFTTGGQQKNTWLVFPKLQQKTYKLNLLAADYTGDTQAELLIYPIEKSSAAVDLFDYGGRLIDRLQIKLSNARGWSLGILSP